MRDGQCRASCYTPWPCPGSISRDLQRAPGGGAYNARLAHLQSRAVHCSTVAAEAAFRRSKRVNNLEGLG